MLQSDSLFVILFILPKKHDEENEEIHDLTDQCGLVVFLLLFFLLVFIQLGLIVNLAVTENTGVRIHHNI